jgi:hypothetical protein
VYTRVLIIIPERKPSHTVTQSRLHSVESQDTLTLHPFLSSSLSHNSNMKLSDPLLGAFVLFVAFTIFSGRCFTGDLPDVAPFFANPFECVIKIIHLLSGRASWNKLVYILSTVQLQLLLSQLVFPVASCVYGLSALGRWSCETEAGLRGEPLFYPSAPRTPRFWFWQDAGCGVILLIITIIPAALLSLIPFLGGVFSFIFCLLVFAEVFVCLVNGVNAVASVLLGLDWDAPRTRTHLFFTTLVVLEFLTYAPILESYLADQITTLANEPPAWVKLALRRNPNDPYLSHWNTPR